MESKVNKAVLSAEKAASPEQIVMDGAAGRPANKPKVADNAIREPGATDEQFPTNAFQSQDKRDVKEAAKLALVKEGKDMGLGDGVTPFGKAHLTDQDIKWLQSKKEVEAYANFQQWFAANFDKMSPAEKQYAREAFPTFYAERLKQLEKSIDLQGRLAKIKLLGIKSKDDMLLQWAAESGYIDSDPLENILHPERLTASRNKAERQERFQRGLFNPKARGRGDWGLNDRQKNSDEFTGRTGPLGSKAPTMGIDGNPFSVYGDVTAAGERNIGTGQLFKGILKGDPSFLSAVN